MSTLTTTELPTKCSCLGRSHLMRRRRNSNGTSPKLTRTNRTLFLSISSGGPCSQASRRTTATATGRTSFCWWTMGSASRTTRMTRTQCGLKWTSTCKTSSFLLWSTIKGRSLRRKFDWNQTNCALCWCLTSGLCAKLNFSTDSKTPRKFYWPSLSIFSMNGFVW